MNVETQADIERVMVQRNVSFVFRPSVTEQADGNWIARYPGADWSVSGRDADEARQRLHAEQLSRMGDSTHADWKIEAVRQYLENGPIDGVYALDNDTVDRVVDAGTPAALDAAVAAIDQPG
ncbi:hypothetical protein BN1232_06270 [Mycobacterium lentiflavum]|uniref:Uncharacterized protein n=2 Tax=Mycobacterium simiae complex TaxID=2249310 RepID=A0A0E4H2S5_MYCLN|nr:MULTISPECIES: hypothetical protein [Mycobacterium simiae complex]ORJ54322.1 hypothetical protein B5M45_27185 [Mycobacterium simiae]ULP45436.1 hypothetical protein MJO58_28125 [Mycobacterium lentiflavum]CQD24577.1 hypothetical protein BN1232_06270 [Mycobacterium lentiflavum]